MAAKIAENDLIEGTVEDLDDQLSHLREQRDAIDRRIEAVTARREAWLDRLKHLDNGTTIAQKKRFKKGESLELINKLFAEIPRGTGLSLPDIAKRTGVPWSSVRNVVKRADAGYSIDGEGLCHKTNGEHQGVSAESSGR